MTSAFPPHFVYRRVATLSLWAWLLLPATSWALPPGGDQVQVQKLIDDGKYVQALKLLEEQIAKAPKDPQPQFERGVVLSLMGRKPDALEALQKLVADHPNIAPAYNNMAVLYGAMLDYDHAKAALDKAVQIDPNYATAYQNLGDVYVQLATQSYRKSLTLDQSDPTVASKVALLQEALNPGPNKGAVAMPIAAPAPAVTESPASAAAPRPLNAAANASARAQDEVAALVRQWASAWSARDAASYVGFYAPEFTGRSPTHAAWQRERTERIRQRSRIHVEVSGLVVSVAGDEAEARFVQSYTSDGPKETSGKTLNLVRSVEGQWRITKETSDR